MPPSFLPPVFISDPPDSPQVSYQDLDLVRQESPEFLDFFDPFAPHKLEDVLERCSELALEAVRTSDSGASVTSTSPLLTPDMHVCGLDHDDTSFGTDSTTEVDDSFINQISCFSDVSTGSAVASGNISANSSLSHPSTSNPKAAVGAPASFKQMSQPATIISSRQNKIFAPNPPLVLPSQPADIEEWVECTQLVTTCGRMIVSGWEPPENDERPLAIVNLEDWMPPFPAKSATSRTFENGSESQMGLTSKDSVSPEEEMTEDLCATKRSWARRFTSNRQLPESRKRRRIGAGVPQVQDSGMQGTSSCMTTRSYATGQDNPYPNGENTQTQNVCLDNDNMDFKFAVPSYVYPQPAVARAITRRAAEEDRRQAADANMQLLNQQTGNDGEAEEIQRLVDEFLDVPDDMKEQTVGGGETIGSMLLKAFNPSRLPSPAPGSKSGGGRGLRQTRSLLDYSSSTRRRALARSRSELDPQASAPVAKSTLDSDDVFMQFGPIGIFQMSSLNGAEDLDTFPPMKRLLEEDALMSSRSMKRTRAC